MEPYQHTVQYYETDKMGIVHHSNYIRWMEEARVAYLAQLGWNIEMLEAMGAISPVTGLEAHYKQNTTFPEVISIHVSLTQYTGVRLRLHYVMENAGGEVVFEGDSEHCFLDPRGAYPSPEKILPGVFSGVDPAAGRKLI